MESVRLLVLVAVMVTAAAADITVNSSEYTVRLVYKEGNATSKPHKSANLNCSLSRHPFWKAAEKVRWWKTQPLDNVTVEISRDERLLVPDREKQRFNIRTPVQTTSDTIVQSLIIDNIKAEDHGYYRCGVYSENYNATNIWSDQIYIQPDIKVTVNLSSTVAVTNGVSIYQRYTKGQVTSCAAHVFGDPQSVAIQIWEDDQNITKDFTTTTKNQIVGITGFRAAATVVTATSAAYLPRSEENEVLRCEARRNNTVVANSSMVVKLSDKEVVLSIKQEPAVSELGEALQLLCIIEHYHISNKTEFRWMFVHTEKSGAPRTISLTSGEKSDIAQTSFVDNAMLLNIAKYSGRLSNFTVTLKEDNGSTIATTSYDLVLQKDTAKSAAVTWKTYESMLSFIAVIGIVIKQLI